MENASDQPPTIVESNNNTTDTEIVRETNENVEVEGGAEEGGQNETKVVPKAKPVKAAPKKAKIKKTVNPPPTGEDEVPSQDKGNDDDQKEITKSPPNETSEAVDAQVESDKVNPKAPPKKTKKKATTPPPQTLTAETAPTDEGTEASKVTEGDEKEEKEVTAPPKKAPAKKGKKVSATPPPSQHPLDSPPPEVQTGFEPPALNNTDAKTMESEQFAPTEMDNVGTLPNGVGTTEKEVTNGQEKVGSSLEGQDTAPSQAQDGTETSNKKVQKKKVTSSKPPTPKDQLPTTISDGSKKPNSSDEVETKEQPLSTAPITEGAEVTVGAPENSSAVAKPPAKQPSKKKVATPTMAQNKSKSSATPVRRTSSTTSSNAKGDQKEVSNGHTTDLNKKVTPQATRKVSASDATTVGNTLEGQESKTKAGINVKAHPAENEAAVKSTSKKVTTPNSSPARNMKQKPQLSKEEQLALHQQRLAAIEERERKRRAAAKAQLAKIEENIGDIVQKARDFKEAERERQAQIRKDRMEERRLQREEERKRLEANKLKPLAALLAATAITSAVNMTMDDIVVGSATNEQSRVNESPENASSSPARVPLTVEDVIPAAQLKPILAAYEHHQASKQLLNRVQQIEAEREKEERERVERELAARKAKMNASRFVPLPKQVKSQHQNEGEVAESPEVAESSPKRKSEVSYEEEKDLVPSNVSTPRTEEMNDKDKAVVYGAIVGQKVSTEAENNAGTNDAQLDHDQRKLQREEARRIRKNEKKRQKFEAKRAKRLAELEEKKKLRKQARKEEKMQDKKLRKLQKAEAKAATTILPPVGEDTQAYRSTNDRAHQGETSDNIQNLNIDLGAVTPEKNDQTTPQDGSFSPATNMRLQAVASEAAEAALNRAVFAQDEERRKSAVAVSHDVTTPPAQNLNSKGSSRSPSVSSVATSATTSNGKRSPSMSSVSSVSSSNLSLSDDDQGPKEAEENEHNGQNPANNCNATSAAPAFDEEAALRARIDQWKITEKKRRQKEKRKAIERRQHEKERKKRLENLVAGTTTSPTKHGQQQRDKAAENHFQSLEEIREKYLLEKKANTREFQIKQGQHRRAQMQEYGRHAEESNFAEVSHNPDSTTEDGSGNNNNNHNKRRDPSKTRKSRDIMAEALKRHEPMAMQAPAMADYVTKKSQLAPEEELARQKKIVAVGNQYMREAKLKAKASAQGNDDLASGTSSALAPAQQQQFEREQQEEQQRKKIKALGDNYLRQLRLERMEKDKATPNETGDNEGEPPTAVVASNKSAPAFIPRRKHDDSQLASSMPIEKQQQKQEALAKARKEVLALNRKMLLEPLAPLPHQINANSPTATSAPTGTLLATNGSSPFPPKRAGPSTVGTNGRLPPMQQLSASSGPAGSGEAQLDPIVEAINAKMKLLKMLGNNQMKSPTAGDNGAAALGPVRPMRNLKPLTK